MDAKKKKKILAKKPKTVVLDYPIQWGEETVSEITIEPLKAKHMKNLSANPKFSELLDIACKASDQSKAVFDELDSSDAMKVVEAVSDLL